MEHQNILNLLNEASDSKFETWKWNIVNDQSANTKVLKSNFYDYNDAYILLRCYITVAAVHATKVAFKSFAPLTKCI